MVVLVAGSYGLKALGVTAFGGVVQRRLAGVVSLLPAALFAALVTVMTVEQSGALVLDARLAGVAAGSLAVWRKAPFVVVVGLAMAVTASVRALA